MNRKYTKKIVLNSLMISLVFLATYFTRIPTPLPGGYFNLGDSIIMLTAIIMGRKSGFLAGALGSFLADVVCGAFLFAPITLIVKGVEGYITGVIAYCAENRNIKFSKILLAVLVGAVIMISGYFISEAYILGLFDKEFGFTAAVAELIPNFVQGGLSAVVGYTLSVLLIKINIFKYIQLGV